MSRERSRLYRQYTRYLDEENYIQSKINMLENEIVKLKTQWKSNVSQRGFYNAIKPVVKELEDRTGIPLDRVTYSDSPSHEYSAYSYQYIESLGGEVTSYNNRLRSVSRDKNNIKMSLDMLDIEINSMGCH